MTIETVTRLDGKVVGERILNASFDEWIAHVFDHPFESDDWLRELDSVCWDVPHSKTVDYLSETFEGCGLILRRFNDLQVAAGLKYIHDPSCSDIIFALRDESVPLAARKKALHSLQNLYADCFAARCVPALSHLNESPDAPLNGVCYMWWDIFPISGAPAKSESKEIDMECLAVMEFALGLESDACRESALHGLGHWFHDYPEYVEKVVGRFIEVNPSARPELINYAKSASRGGVL